MLKNFFPRKSCRLWDNVEATKATDDNVHTARKNAINLQDKHGKKADTHSLYLIHMASSLINSIWSRNMFYAETHNGETMCSQILRLKKATSKGGCIYFNAAYVCM
jgi:hypothetical protein